jgi:phosphoglycerol transferase MdoB-like AlkP superfamily enzyme
MDTPFHGTDDSDKFRKAAYYTDHCLSAYFKKAKQERWYANTLFILVADHGSRLPKLPDLNMPESKKIPLLFVGDVLKEKIKGTTVDKIGNQNDIAATLLSQLHRDHTSFSRSKDILNPSTKEFAYYTNDNVLGWITPSQSFIYFYTSQKLQLTSDPNANAVVNDSLFMDAKAYLQTHYSQYLAY